MHLPAGRSEGCSCFVGKAGCQSNCVQQAPPRQYSFTPLRACWQSDTPPGQLQASCRGAVERAWPPCCCWRSQLRPPPPPPPSPPSQRRRKSRRWCYRLPRRQQLCRHGQPCRQPMHQPARLHHHRPHLLAQPQSQRRRCRRQLPRLPLARRPLSCRLRRHRLLRRQPSWPVCCAHSSWAMWRRLRPGTPAAWRPMPLAQQV